MIKPTLSSLFLAALATSAHALDFDLTVGYEASYSSNPDRVSTDESEQWIHAPSVALALVQESRLLEIDADYFVERRLYQDDGDGRFDDESIVTGSSLINWNIVPERLIVSVEHDRTESSINAARSAGPQNRQESQRTTARVTYNQPTVRAQHISVQASTSDNSFEQTDNDANVQEARIAYVIPTSEVRRWEIFARSTQTEFDNFDDADYDTENYGLLFASSSPTGSLDVEVGYSEIDPELNTRDGVTGLTGSFELRRGVTTPLEWGFSLSQEIGDRLNSMSRGTIDIQTDVDLFDSGLAEIYRSTFASGYVTHTSGTNSLTVELQATEDDYEFIARDRRTDTVMLRFDRRMREDLSFSSFVSYSEYDFEDLEQEDEAVIGQIALEWDVNRQLSLSTSISYQDRSSNAAFANYDEWVWALAANYQVFD